MELYSPPHAYQISINTLEIGYSDRVLSASAVLIHDRAYRLLWSLRHNFILIYFRVVRDNYKYYSSWGAYRLQPNQPYYLRCSAPL